MFAELKEKVKYFPERPGVYLLKDHNGRIIYVGKALSLRQRVRSYLVENKNPSPRLRLLQANLSEIDYLVTDSEVEALILECNLIKEYRPRFNVNLKDDKDFPYLILTADHYPRLELMRLSQKDSRRGRSIPLESKEERRFGPYTDVGAVRETMQLLGSLFPLRRCRQPLDGRTASARPCLNYQMNRCLAPCRGKEKVPYNDYDGLVRQVVMFLRGNYGGLEKALGKQMHIAAEEHRFEEAASLRDRISALQRVAGQQQKVLSADNSPDRDVLALVRFKQKVAVHLFKIREGKLLSQDHFPLSGAGEVADDEVMSSFVKSYYNRADSLPDEILFSTLPSEIELLGKWLKEITGRKISLRFPRRGSLKNLVKLALTNGILKLKEEQARQERMIEEPLQELAKLLGLSKMPLRIEGYDISHLGGKEPVGVMVVFQNGEPFKDGYRRFNIQDVVEGDDYAALQEVIKRRSGKTLWPPPDLLLIDGGKGQLNAVLVSLCQTPMKDIPIIALAKNPDRLFLEGSGLPVLLNADSALLKLLQRIRDEAHRFAVSGQRSRRKRSLVQSRLEQVPGIGPVRRKALLEHFGSISQIKEASAEQLQQVDGINETLADLIVQHMNAKAPLNS